MTENLPGPDGPGERRTTFDAPPPMGIDVEKTYTAEMVTSLGTMTIHLDPIRAPETVNNFVFLARWRYYDGIVFHRVIKGFMIQGGAPEGSGSGGPGYRFKDELPAPGRYELGSLAMANAGPNTNGSQFFIVHGAQVGLRPLYTIFGQVTSGLDTVDAIADSPVRASERGEASSPIEPIIIDSIEITRR